MFQASVITENLATFWKYEQDQAAHKNNDHSILKKITGHICLAVPV